MNTKLILYKINPKADVSAVIVNENELPWGALTKRLNAHQSGAFKSAQLVEIRITKNGD